MDTEDLSLKEFVNLLEVEPLSGSEGCDAPGPDIPALREQLSVLVSTGRAKEAIGVQLTHDQVKRLSDKDVQKYNQRYKTYVGSKTTESLMDSFIFVATKAMGLFVKIKDIEAYQKELKNDYIINKEPSTLAGQLAFTCGKALSVASAALITAKHIEYGGQQDSSPNVEQLPTISE